MQTAPLGAFCNTFDLHLAIIDIENQFFCFLFEWPLKTGSTHKHLGIYLSTNNKWTKHIDSIIMSASKQVSYLRKLKYKLSKDTLNKLYCTYIRPLLEYGSEVWDGCSYDTNRLEQIQLNAARIVTGLPIFASLHSLYFEAGWENLADRRQIRKLTLMYKIVNGDAPSYLSIYCQIEYIS